MKGITPVIAIILLMMVTIAMVGFTYIWMKRVFSTTANSTSEQINSEQAKIAQRISIIKASNSTGEITIRNIGSQSIETSKLATFVNGNLVSCDWGTSKLAPGDIATCSATCPAGKEVDVNAPGGTDTATCE